MKELDEQVYKSFEEVLNKKLEICPSNWDEFRSGNLNILSEDNIRYLFFQSLINNYKEAEIILELPFCYLKDWSLNYALDAILITESGKYAFEIKYHRNYSESGNATTRQAGQIINDLNRLHLIEHIGITKDNTKIYFIYLTDDEMDKYLSKKRNGLYEFYCSESFCYDKSLRADISTFQDAITYKLPDGDKVAVHKAWKNKELKNNHSLIIWEVN